jgi:hypothetical protein
MTTFTTQDRQDAQRGLAEEITDSLALSKEILRIGEILGLKTTSSDYNTFKVMEVIKQLIDASRLASKPMKKRPLTERQISEIHNEVCGWGDPSNDKVEFARAIERAHGIGE